MNKEHKTYTFSGIAVIALLAFSFSSASLETPGTQRTLQLPSHAANAPVISLGTAIDPSSGLQVEGIAFIDYKKNFHSVLTLILTEICQDHY